MRLTPLAAVTFPFLLSSCCLPTWPELQYTRTKPSDAEIIGNWLPTGETITDIRKRGRYPVTEHELTLRADHTFTMRNMPDWWLNGFGESHGHFDSGEGTW